MANVNRPNWNIQHESPLTARPNYPGYAATVEAFREVMDKGIDKVAKLVFAEPFQGEAFVRFEKVKRDHGKNHSFRGWTGTTPLRRDADALTVASKGIAWPWEWQTYSYGQAIFVERRAIELDEVGFLKGSQTDLLTNHKRTVEYAIADHFNRAFGTSGAPRLSLDGKFYISDSRPNPNPEAPSWSNLEAPADISENTLFTASYNARMQIGPDGYKYPQRIKKLMTSPAHEQSFWKLLKSEKVLGSNHNDPNWASDAFSMEDVITYDYMDIDAVFYWLSDPKSEDNQLVLYKRVEPSILTEWGMGGNPDVLGQRLRAEWGLALGDPRKSIRGGLIVSGS